MSGYNPDYNPTGIEGGLDTNTLPWLSLAQAPGLRLKPLRASIESGMFSAIVQIEAGASPHMLYLGAADLYLLSGEMSCPDGDFHAQLEPGVWGFIPANTRIQGLRVARTVEYLCNFYGPVAFIGDSGAMTSLCTAKDVLSGARDAGITLVPNTLAECMQPRPENVSATNEPLAIADDDMSRLATRSDGPAHDTGSPYFIDTRAVPWIVNPDLPDIALKVLRVSEETGITSLIVRHNGVAGPHYHLGAADFLVLSGRIGYRAGPAEGYGPGMWFYEPAGARHEATQRIGDDEDLIYTANVYGPVQFDEGEGTPIAAIQSWMQYKALADAQGINLVRNAGNTADTLLAWAPVTTTAA